MKGGGSFSERPRAILLIANSAAPYSRGLRVARSLTDAGFDVEIAATTARGVPDQEQDGLISIRRHRPSGRWAGWASDATGGEPSMRRMPLGPVGRLARRALKPVLTALPWPVHVRAW